MLWFVIALVYAALFFRSAKSRQRPQPAAWAVTGLIVFWAPAFLSMWAVSAVNPVHLVVSYDGSEPFLKPQFLVPFAVDSLTAFLIANMFALLLWSAFLRPAPWGFKDASQKLARRRVLALPGKFPWFFALVFPATAMLGIVLTAAFNPPQPVPSGMPALDDVNWRFLSTLIQTVALSVILRRFNGWAPIAAGWAAVLSVITLGFYILIMIKVGVFIPALLTGLPIKFASIFALIAATALAVRRWGATLPVLLGAHLGARLVIDLSFMIIDGHAEILDVVSAQISGLFLVLALYLSFLFYEEKKT